MRTLLTACFAALFGITLATLDARAQGPRNPNVETAIFAGGCFWCTEADFDKVPGVLSTTSGYIGGKTENPTYKDISRGDTGHTEAVKIMFDTTKVDYPKLVEIFWRTVDIFDKSGQFCDRGDQYRPEIFATSPEQRRIAEASKAALTASKRFDKPIVVAVTDATKFTDAEDYHQDFYTKSPIRYFTYRTGCGRDARLSAIWGAEAGGKTLLTH